MFYHSGRYREYRADFTESVAAIHKMKIFFFLLFTIKTNKIKCIPPSSSSFFNGKNGLEFRVVDKQSIPLSYKFYNNYRSFIYRLLLIYYI